MGLDNFWDLPANVVVEFEPPLKLYGGGQGMFRGKVYNSFFQNQLDVSLYEGKTNEEVREIADRLKEVQWEEEFTEEYRGFEDEEDLENLKRMFEAYAKVGASLKSWY